MKPLEDWIKHNREILDSDEPQSGHQERFLEKLDRQQRILGRRQAIRSFVRIAAILLVMLSLAGGLYYETGIQGGAKETVAGMPPELKEAEQFYNQQLQTKYDIIRSLHFPDESMKAKILSDISQNDDSYARLKEDLKANPGNEMTFDAMIEYYQTRLDVVNKIIMNLEQVLNNNHIETLKYGGSHETIA